MGRHQVKAGKSHLEQYSDRPPVDALVELIWNALDAEADRVAVKFERDSLGDGAAEHISRIWVEDNGHGIDPSTVVERFTSLGDSWKLGLNGLSLNGKRVLHGRQGRGRFFAYSLGPRVSWETVWQDGDGKRWAYRIEGNSSAINEFADSSPAETDRQTGTTVDVRVEQGRTLSSLLAGDLADRLAGRMAPHLLGNPDIEVRVDGQRLDPGRLIAAQPPDVDLDEVDEELRGHPRPVLRLIEWGDDVRNEMPTLVLCNEGGAALAEFDRRAKAAVRVTGYLLWPGFATTRQDLLIAEMSHGSILDAARKRISDYVRGRSEELRGSIVQQLVQEGSYPYPTARIESPVEEAERQLYDMMLVAAHPAIGGSRRERRMTARLLQVAVHERARDVDVILDEVLGLSPDVKDLLQDLLRDTSLASIVTASGEIRSRIELVVGLRRLLYSPDTAKKMREVDQLHPLVRDNVWLFGEEWRLARSEASLTNVLRSVVPDTIALEEDLRANGGQVRRSDGTTGRVDLLLQRLFRGPGQTSERLVVELKRPSTTVGVEHLNQVRSYARALEKHQGAGPGKWTFWLVGAAFNDDLLAEADQSDRSWGHVAKRDNYDIFVARWSDLIEQAEHRLEFVREQLDLEVTQDEAARRLRQRHGDLIPAIDGSDRAAPKPETS
jgi:hypothetical protein